MEILRIEKLCKYYGNDNTLVKALNDINFSVEKGEFVAVVGASGSGKTQCIMFSLLKILAKKGESMIVTDPKGELYEDVFKDGYRNGSGGQSGLCICHGDSHR